MSRMYVLDVPENEGVIKVAGADPDLAIDRAKRRRQAQAPKPNPCTWPAMRRGRPPWGRCCAA